MGAAGSVLFRQSQENLCAGWSEENSTQFQERPACREVKGLQRLSPIAAPAPLAVVWEARLNV